MEATLQYHMRWAHMIEAEGTHTLAMKMAVVANMSLNLSWYMISVTAKVGRCEFGCYIWEQMWVLWFVIYGWLNVIVNELYVFL